MKKICLAAAVLLLMCGPAAAEEKSWYPINTGDEFVYNGYFKSKPLNKFKATAAVVESRDIDGKRYFFFNVPGFDIRFFARSDEKAAYMKLVRYPYPLFKFLSYDVVLKKEIDFVRYPFVDGEKWRRETEGAAMLWPVVIKRKITADFDVTGPLDAVYKGKAVDAWHVRMIMEIGDKNPMEENHWYVEGIGYVRGDTKQHFVELEGFRLKTN